MKAINTLVLNLHAVWKACCENKKEEYPYYSSTHIRRNLVIYWSAIVCRMKQALAIIWINYLEGVGVIVYVWVTHNHTPSLIFISILSWIELFYQKTKTDLIIEEQIRLVSTIHLLIKLMTNFFTNDSEWISEVFWETNIKN